LPLAARAQSEPMRRIGVLMNTGADDPEGRSRIAAFLGGLQQLGWTDGRNVRIDIRWPAGDADLVRKYAAESGQRVEVNDASGRGFRTGIADHMRHVCGVA